MARGASVIVDTSALLAIAFGEPLAPRLIAALVDATERAVGAPTLLESEIVISARAGKCGVNALRRLVDEFAVRELPFGTAHRRAATEAFATYGKGRHPARLNVGDCMAYATAKIAGAPLLCLGEDFARTDLELVALR